ncbi:uncharacterized protein SOCE26_091350 [Sorangium cellulosum]|uniref:Uncharacterized protein n=1 Tax=Sorangium cellulosum TaxID=56 RepID=A0A2L0F7V2_SORCE|nr:hypothetical protein [Sorangium cellulosum]AUX47613.1 uncharacterized protein SOCE26_091350 [Sorangium cellulosum]
MAGCDPEGPGVSGTLHLGEGVTATDFTALHLRAAPDPGVPFDPSAPSFPSAGGDGDSWFFGDEDLSGVTFPHDFSGGEGVGTTPHERWRLFAWLSTSLDGSAPASGEPYGTTTFTIDSCSAQFGDYCTVTEGVTLTIDTIAP